MRAKFWSLLIVSAAITVGARAEEPINFAISSSHAQKELAQQRSELKDYHDNQYMLDLAQKIKQAKDWVKRRAHQVSRPALVLDIDETSLSNWEEIFANDFVFVATGPCGYPAAFPCGNQAWDQSTRATVIRPTLELYQEAITLGVQVFFITGRFEDPTERAATENNLWKAGYQGWSNLYLRAAGVDRTVAAYKTRKRKEIEDLGFTIIANVGDQTSDLVDAEGNQAFAEKAFKLPNPFYLIPVEP
jgi:acid phosphatase